MNYENFYSKKINAPFTFSYQERLINCNQMSNLSRIVSIAIPTAIGIGTALLGVRILKNEKRLSERKVELELQLKVKSLRVFSNRQLRNLPRGKVLSKP